MILSLSVRIAESFLSKEEARLPLEEVAALARQTGFHSLCMRASQVGVHSSAEAVETARRTLARQGIRVSMITGDFATVYNNDQGPAMLRAPAPYFRLAKALGAPLIRVALKTVDDIPWARRAAEQAAEHGLALAHQCHVQSLFETVEQIEATLREINRPNFGLIFEPANLEQCGQEYGGAVVQRLAPWIRNVYLQNQRLDPQGSITLETWTRGPVSFDLLPIAESGGIDFPAVFAGLRAIGYAGPITAHQSAPENWSALEAAQSTANFIRGLL